MGGGWENLSGRGVLTTKGCFGGGEETFQRDVSTGGRENRERKLGVYACKSNKLDASAGIFSIIARRLVSAVGGSFTNEHPTLVRHLELDLNNFPSEYQKHSLFRSLMNHRQLGPYKCGW